MTDLAPLIVFLTRRSAVQRGVENAHEMLFYLKNQYLPHNEERAFIEGIPQEERFTYEVICNYLKTFSKSIAEVENMSLKNKVLLGIWISTGAKVFRSEKNVRVENLPGRFENWMYRECKIKK